MKKMLNIIKKIILNPKRMIPFYFAKIKVRLKRKNPNVVTLEHLIDFIDINKVYYESNVDSDVTIIIPVYNGLEHFKKMFTSLITNTNNVNVLIINDCSSDPSVHAFLNTINKYNIKIINNEKNLGFVKTINKAMSLVTTKYAVWVNSDVILTKDWIEKILSPFKSDNNVASVTPFTNSATIFSFPYINQNNLLIDEPEIINTAFSKIVCPKPEINNVLTGVGFCMAINMHAWDIVGPLDEEKFGKGYGEENDWCFRAVNCGFTNRLAFNLFIPHYHGGSFNSKEKEKLINEHSSILVEKYYKYMAIDLPLFSYNDPWNVYRKVATLLLAAKDGEITFYHKNANKQSLAKSEMNITYNKKMKLYNLEFSKSLDPLNKNFISINSLSEINLLKKLFRIRIKRF